jgi:hypothetical protein
MRKLFIVIIFTVIMLSLNGCSNNYAPRVIPKEHYSELASMKREYCKPHNSETELSYYKNYIDNLMFSHKEMELYIYNYVDLTTDELRWLQTMTNEIKDGYKEDIESLYCDN